MPSKRIETTSETIGEILAMLIILGPAAPFILHIFALSSLGGKSARFSTARNLVFLKIMSAS